MEKFIDFLKRINLGGTIDKIVIDVDEKGIGVRCKDEWGMVAIFAFLNEKVIDKSIGIQNLNGMLKIIGINSFDKLVCNNDSIIFKGDKSKLEWKLGEISTLQSVSKTKEEVSSVYSETKTIIDIDETILVNLKKAVPSIEFANKINLISDGNELILSGIDDVFKNNYEVSIFKAEEGKKIKECNNFYKKEIFNKVISTIDFKAKMEYDNVENKPFPLHVFGVTDSGIEIDYFIAPIQE
jgi:hypothetical protein